MAKFKANKTYSAENTAMQIKVTSRTAQFITYDVLINGKKSYSEKRKVDVNSKKKECIVIDTAFGLIAA